MISLVLIGGEDSESSFPYDYFGGMYLTVLRGKLNFVLFKIYCRTSMALLTGFSESNRDVRRFQAETTKLPIMASHTCWNIL